MGKKYVRANRREHRRTFGDVTSRFLYRVFDSYKRRPIACEARSLLLRGRWGELVRLSIDPRGYETPREFAVDYLIAEIASKVPPEISGSTSEQLKQAAMDKFMECEVQCQATNQRLAKPESYSFRLSSGRDVYEIYHLARKNIDSCLGEFSWNEASTLFGFGPGATTRLARKHADLYYKFGRKPDTTHHNLALSVASVRHVSHWLSIASEGTFPGAPETMFNIVKGNKVTTVPKNSKTDRVIAIEPDMNAFVQKGIGGVLRRRLRRVGVDLDDQTLNQRLAKEGSIDGSLATIDLSSASDTVASRVVELLLPEEWYRAMNITRSHFGVLDNGDLIRYHKFSSMGNGFTFELESLIFWALAKSVVQYLKLKDRRLGIYGDDIIIPTEATPLLLKVIEVFGFTPNAKKTFSTGPFRESCGKHYFKGRDVTPFYLRKQLNNPQPLFVAVNNLRRWVSRLDDGAIRPPQWSLYREISKLVPRDLRAYRGPDGYGDSFLIGNFEECVPERCKSGIEGWQVYGYRMLTTPLYKKGKCPRVSGEPLLTKSFYRLARGSLDEKSAMSDELAPRLLQPLYVRSKFHVLQWPNVGFPLR